MMRSRFFLALLLLSCFFLFSGFAPSGGSYMDVSTSELGDVRIYTNSNYRTGAFALDNGVPVNMTGSTIYGYVLDQYGNKSYNIYMYSYGEDWEFRRLDQGSSYDRTLTVNSVNLDTSTIEFMGVDIPQSDWILYLFVFLIGGLLVLLWCKR